MSKQYLAKRVRPTQESISRFFKPLPSLPEKKTPKIKDCIPANPYIDTSEQWLEEFAPEVCKCVGYMKDLRAQVVASPTNSLDVCLMHGSFGVNDVENCQTTLHLLSVLEPICTYLGYGVPNIVFIDLVTVHVLKARWFADCKGDKFYVSPDDTTIPATRAAQKYSDETTQALEAAGFKVMKLVLSKNVHNCYKLAGCENAKLPYLATHPCIAWSNPIILQGNVGDLQV